MDCLDANVVQELMAGSLDESARALAIAHLDGCVACRDRIGTPARDALRETVASGVRNIALDATAAPDDAVNEPW